MRVEYATPGGVDGVKVHETGGTGGVTKIELIDDADVAHTVWSETDATPCGTWLEVKLERTAYRVKAVKLSTVGTLNIDAVGLVAGPPPGPTLTDVYEYDANGLRTYKSDTAGESRYLLDGLAVVAQYATNGQRQAFYTQSLARIDEVLSVVNAAGKYWYQADALGSIYTLTTASGNIQARGGYDVFGAPVAISGQQIGQPFGFTGREHELDAGLVYARARYLNTSTARWDRPDPVGMLDDANRYSYVRQRSTTTMDPTGMFSTATHNYIATEAAALYVSPEDISAVMAASADADKSEYQVPWYSYRHGMRALGQSVEEAITAWSDFVVTRLTIAAEEYQCDRPRALLALGHGFHAVTDAVDSVHRFQTWNSSNPIAIAAHFVYEKDERRDDPDVQTAIVHARYYFDAFAMLRRSSIRFGARQLVIAYYGWQLPAEAVWLASN